MINLKHYAYYSVCAAIVTIALKAGAYFVTNSVGLLSDACESLVNLCASLFVLYSLIVSAQPEDKEHAFGHTKIEYFSSAIEGFLILVAALGISWAAVDRIITPREISHFGLGTIIAVLASIINFCIARTLYKAGKKYNSVALIADSHHLMVDVWTSVAVVLGVSIVWFTGYAILDPIIALLMVVNIVFTGIGLISQSCSALMDASISDDKIEIIEEIFKKYKEKGADFHALRTRQAGVRSFVSFHVLLPGEWSVSKAHHFVEEVERDVRRAIEKVHLDTHIEPIEDESAYQDIGLDRDDEI